MVLEDDAAYITLTEPDRRRSITTKEPLRLASANALPFARFSINVSGRGAVLLDSVKIGADQR